MEEAETKELPWLSVTVSVILIFPGRSWKKLLEDLGFPGLGKRLKVWQERTGVSWALQLLREEAHSWGLRIVRP